MDSQKILLVISEISSSSMHSCFENALSRISYLETQAVVKNTLSRNLLASQCYALIWRKV